MENESSFSNMPYDNAAPVEEIVLSDSDEEEPQPSYPPNLVFVPGNRAGMIDESEVDPMAESPEEVYPGGFVTMDEPEKASNGFVPEQQNGPEESVFPHSLINGASGSSTNEATSGPSVLDPESGLLTEETTTEDPSEPVADVLNPFFCDFEELNRQYFGANLNQNSPSCQEKPKRAALGSQSEQNERRLAEAQLEELGCKPRTKPRNRPGQNKRVKPSCSQPKLANQVATNETAVEEVKVMKVSMKRCSVCVDRLTLDLLVKNNASQSSIDLFLNKKKENAADGVKNLPPKLENSQKPLNSSNRSNVKDKSRWSAAGMASRLKILTDEALMAMNQLQNLDKNGSVNPIRQMKSHIQAKLSHTLVSGRENGAISNIKSTAPETSEVKPSSFKTNSPLNDLKIKTKDLRVLIKDLKTEKTVRIGNRIKPVSEILSELGSIKTKMKDHSVPIPPPNVQVPVTSSPYFENSSASESFVASGNPSASGVTSGSNESSSSAFKPRLTVRKDLFAPEVSTSNINPPVPPIIPSTHFASGPDKINLSSAKSGSSSALPNIFNSASLSSLKVGLQEKLLKVDHLKGNMSHRLSFVLTNPNATSKSNVQQSSSSTLNSNKNIGKFSCNAQYSGLGGSNSASAEQISAFTDTLLSFLPKTNTSSSSNINQQRQPKLAQNNSMSRSLLINNRQKVTSVPNVSSNFIRRNGPSTTSQQKESDIMSDSDSVSSCSFKSVSSTSSDTDEPGESVILCEETGQIIEPSISCSKENQKVESATEKSSTNLSSSSLHKGQEKQSTNQNSNAAESSNQHKQSAILEEEDAQNTLPSQNKENEPSVQDNETSDLTAVLCEETGHIIDTSESHSKENRQVKSAAEKSSENILSNSHKGHNKQSLDYNDDAEESLKQHQESSMSENTQSTVPGQNLELPTMQDNGSSLSAKNSQQKKMPSFNSANLESSSQNKPEESSARKDMDAELSVNDHLESPSTSFSTSSDNELAELSSSDESKRQNSDVSFTESSKAMKINVKHQVLSKESLRISDLIIKKCTVVLEDCKKLISEKQSDESSDSLSLSAEEDCQISSRNNSPVCEKKTRFKASEVKEDNIKVPENARSNSLKAQKRRRSESPEVKASTSSELSVVRAEKRSRSPEDGDEGPRKKRKPDGSSSEQLTPVIFDLADENFPGLSVIDDILAVDGTFDVEPCHEVKTRNKSAIKTRARKKIQRSSYGTLAQHIFSFNNESAQSGAFLKNIMSGDGTCDLKCYNESTACDKTVVDSSLEKKGSRSQSSLRSMFNHFERRLFDVGNIALTSEISNEFHLDGNLDSEASDDEVLLEKRARLKGKSMSSKTKPRKALKKQINSNKSLPESSVGTKCSVIVSDFAVDKNLVCMSSKKSSDTVRVGSGYKISEIKSSPNIKAFDQCNKMDEKLTGRKPVIKVIRLNYEKVKDGISVFDFGRTLSATSRSTSVNRRKQGKPRKYGFNINNRNGGVKSHSKIISDLHFMVRNPKKRSK